MITQTSVGKKHAWPILHGVRSHIGDQLFIINGSRSAKYFQTAFFDFLDLADGRYNA